MYILTWSGTEVLLSSSGIPGGVPPAISRGQEHPKKTAPSLCFKAVPVLGGLSHTLFHTGVSKAGAPLSSVGESTFPFYVSCDSYRDGMNSIYK